MMETPLYNSLGDNEIRLVRILPAPQSPKKDTTSKTWTKIQSKFRYQTADEDLVHCQLSYHNLIDKSPKYIAHRRRIRAKGRISKPDPFDSWYEAYSEKSIEPVTTWDVQRSCYRYRWGDYMALSYAWVDPKFNHDVYIILNGKRIKVSANLELALRALRDRQKDARDPPKFWIDALSINQEDLTERSQQVQRMGDIFGGSFSVVVWLGREEDDSHKAIRLIEEVNKIMPSWNHDRATMLVNNFRRSPSYCGDGAWRAFYHLIHRRYWTRLWILQELSKGNERVPVMCGRDTIQWRKLIRVVNLVNHNFEVMEDVIKKDLGRAIEVDASNSILLKINRLLDLSRIVTPKTVKRDEPTTPLGVLKLATQSNASDDRDKVYGVITMIEKPIAALVLPDYKKSVEEVYISFARAFIDGSRNLDIICQSHIHKNRDLPSWVPDWTNPPQWRNLSRRRMPSTYHASGQPRPLSKHSFDLTSRLLTVEGVKFDVIDGHGSTNSFSPTVNQPKSKENVYGEAGVRDALNRTLRASRSLKEDEYEDGGFQALDIPWTISEIENLSLTNMSLSSMQESLMRLRKPPQKGHLSSDGREYGYMDAYHSDDASADVLLPLGTNIPERKKTKENPWKGILQQPSYDEFKDFRHRNRHQLVFGKELQSYFTRSSRDGTPGTPDDAMKTFLQVWTTLDARCLATTERGFIGVLPSTAKRGDIVAVLWGCSVPVILRPHGEHYQLVGECYVHGIMQGLVSNLVKTGECKAEEITLC